MTAPPPSPKATPKVAPKVSPKVSSVPSAPSASETFVFRGAFAERAKKELAKYPAGRQQSAVLALLDLAQRQNSRTHCVTDAAMETIAARLSMSRMRLEEVASFYTMIRREPTGKHHIQCCMTTPCWLSGGDRIKRRIEETLGIRNGETSEDGTFTLSEVECLGACANAPVVQINDDMFEDLSPESMEGILAQLKKGQSPKAGSQRGRRGAEPADLSSDDGQP